MRTSTGQRWVSIILAAALAYPAVSSARGEAIIIKNARHSKVFYEKGRFAGWPANNGIWQWGNEILAGFSLGYLAPAEKGGLHQIDPERPRSIMLTRSLDGGETWQVCQAGYPDGEPTPFPTDIAFDSPGFALNARGETAFISLDRGRTWSGPFRLPFADLHLRARTDYQVLGPKDLMLFLTAQKTNDREGRPFCARTRTGGIHWNQFSWIGPEPTNGYSIMPSSILMPDGVFLVALRRRGNKPEQHNFIELFASQDGGLSWQFLANPVEENGRYSGNPPSLVRLSDGRLCITYANRDEPRSIRAVFSSNKGKTWGPEYIIRSGAGEPDVGYTRTVQRLDGKLVTVYYWLDEPRTERYIAATIWAAPDAKVRSGKNTFSASEGAIALKVDFALPRSEQDPTPVPGTLKGGWTPFAATRWADMYMHDAVWEDGSGGVTPPKTSGLGGSGVHVLIDCGGSGNGGFHVHGLCRDNLGGGGRPRGRAEGEPIANGWFHNVDWGGENRGDILVRINGLPAGEYEMTCYHNHWEPKKQSTRNCLDQPSQMPPINSVRAMALPAAPLAGYRGWSMGLGTGGGVTSLLEAEDVKVTSVTSDAEVCKSLIRFRTDGSNDVLVVIDGGNDEYPDPARKGREGHKAVLNAFELEVSNPKQAQ
ncbi:MAG: sialidase family protein [Planctomycetota bacterium]|jgi:hypothetical protein